MTWMAGQRSKDWKVSIRRPKAAVYGCTHEIGQEMRRSLLISRENPLKKRH